MKIYISGPISTDPNYKARFLAAESMLRMRGYETINPGKLYLVAGGLTWKQYMKLCMKLVRMADAIYMLNGFERSQGAMMELNRAALCRKKIFYETDGVPRERGMI